MTKTGKSFGQQLSLEAKASREAKLNLIQKIAFFIGVSRLKNALLKEAKKGKRELTHVDFNFEIIQGIELFESDYSRELSKVLLEEWLIKNEISYKHIHIGFYRITVKGVSW